ncbi:MAG: hypothetical protein HYT79_00045 [Elusimicrobia bacterium]|nr:hypothetical protein [Elusimicrobiota bacterium]
MEDTKQVWRDYRQKVLERIGDFSDLFSSLKKQKTSGDGWVAACCPFHDDQNPSFAFNRSSGKWACFAGCGKGSAFDFLMNTTGFSFKDALVALGDKTGIPRPSFNGHKPEQFHEGLVKAMTRALNAQPSALRYLKEKRGLSNETIQKYELGWDVHRRRLAIPVRDEQRRFVNIRLYSPTQKPKMINFKGHGNTPRLYGADELAKYEGKQVILCEGELDRLILQQNGFAAVTSTHGCASFREEWLPLFKGKDVVVIYDCDPEGQAAVEGIVLRAFKKAQIASIKNIQLPLLGTKDDKDVSDFFTKPRNVNGELLEKRCYSALELQKLIDDASSVDLDKFAPADQAEGKNGPDLLQVIDSIRNAKDLTAHERYISVAQTAAEHLAKKGAFFYDPKSSLEYLCLEGQLYTVGNNRLFNSLLQKIGQFNVTTSEGKFAWEFLRNFVRSSGSPIKSAGWVFGDPAKPAIYIHTHDEKGRILKIEPNRITLMPNGQNEDKVILAPSDRVQPFAYLENADLAQGLKKFKELLFDEFPCSLTDRALLASFASALFLKDFCPAKPLLRLSGSTDSGKTTAAKLIGYLIFGEDIAKSGTIASFYIDASRNPLSILDNLEVANIKGELLDFLLTGATGIVHEKRKLFTDEEIIREKATAFIVTTGIESLGKPELLSRQWEVPCDSSHHDPRFSQGGTIQKILKSRNLILSAIFNLLAHQILPQIEKRREVEFFLKREFKDHPKDRTFEALALVFLIWDALESPMGLEENLWMKWLGSQKAESEETSIETNVVLQFLNLFRASFMALRRSTKEKAKDEFLEKYHAMPKEDERGFFFEASAGELLHIFTMLAREHGYPRTFENARQLMARLKEVHSLLARAGWRVDLKVRVRNGDRVHRFWLEAENDQKQGALPGMEA